MQIPMSVRCLWCIPLYHQQTSGEAQTLLLQCWKALSSNTCSGWKVTPGVALPVTGKKSGRPKLYQREMNWITHRLIVAITLLINSSPGNLWVAWGILVLVIQGKMKIPKRSHKNGDCLSVSNLQEYERCEGDIRMRRLKLRSYPAISIFHYRNCRHFYCSSCVNGIDTSENIHLENQLLSPQHMRIKYIK